MTTNPSDSEAPRAAQAAQKLKEAAATVRETAGEAVGGARQKVATAYATTREKAARATERTATSVEKNPLSVLIGGLAIGAIAGAVLPRTRREVETLGNVGKRIRGAAGEAAKAAKRAGTETLDSLGVNGEAARVQAKKLIDSAVSAATSAGEAAVKTARAATSKKD